MNEHARNQIRGSDREPFVWDPEEQRWLDPWQVTMRLHLPGVPKRWEELGHGSHEDRTYRLTVREAGGPARWVKFRVSPESGWQMLEDGMVMWATNYMNLDLHGRKLEGYNPRRRKQPARSFEKYLLWQVQEIGLEECLTTLPEEPETTYAISKRELSFLEAEPTPLELRVQALTWHGETVPHGHPLKWLSWLQERGRREFPLLGANGTQVYRRRSWEDWEDLRQREGLSVDDALLAIHTALGAWPQYGGDNPDHPLNHDRLDQWERGSWSETDVETMRAMAILWDMESLMIRTAMRTVDQYREHLARGGSFVLPFGPEQAGGSGMTV
ncbi:MAG: hypothetical protein ACM3RP_10765 [Chitinophagales bacterium]